MLEWAIAMQYRTDNPSERLGPVLGKQRKVVRHMRALPHREVAATLAAIRTATVQTVVKLVFEFMVLTAARPGEARGARWSVPHGFRSTFRDWAAEETNHPRAVVEAALAHTVRGKVEAAYARSDLFERRRRLMN